MAELREQIELTTPLTGKKVVIRGYITGRIKQEIQNVYLSTATFDDKGKAQLNGSTVNTATNKALELIVLSVDGKTDGVLDAVLDLPEQDFDYVKGEVDKIQNPLAKPTAKSSETPTTTT